MPPTPDPPTLLGAVYQVYDGVLDDGQGGYAHDAGARDDGQGLEARAADGVAAVGSPGEVEVGSVGLVRWVRPNGRWGEEGG
jgi:hypothetical protein